MNNEFKEHYDNLSFLYDSLWTYSEEFISYISEQIISILELKENDVLVDCGCGTGIYTKAILEKMNLKHKVICTDLSEGMLSSLMKEQRVVTIPADAIAFSAMDMTYDKVFIKEMIHHIEIGKEILYKNIYNHLTDNGIFTILLLPPTIEYPLFQKAIQYYEEHQPHYSEIAVGMGKCGFKTNISQIHYPLNIKKEKYFNMVRQRYMSLLSVFSDEEIESGISELEEKYKNIESLKFNDNFIVVTGRK